MTALPDAPLPRDLAEIASLVGHEAAVTLAQRLGGSEVYVPRPAALTADHPIVSAIGESLAREVAARFAGESLYIPMARRAVVTSLIAAGSSVSAVARCLGISQQTVRRYRRGR